MGTVKKEHQENEEKRIDAFDRKMKGYEKKIIVEEGEVSMYCPGCGYPLSKSDLEKDNCPHMDCGFSFLDKNGERRI